MGRKLTIDEACERLHISRKHWNQLVFRNAAPPRIVISPRKFLVDEDVLEEWLRSKQESSKAIAS